MIGTIGLPLQLRTDFPRVISICIFSYFCLLAACKNGLADSPLCDYHPPRLLQKQRQMSAHTMILHFGLHTEEGPLAMRPVARIAWLITVVALALAACNRNPFLSAQQSPIWQQSQKQPYAAQLQELSQRASELDVNNRDLHAQLAQSQQQMQLLRDEVALLQKRLAETARQLKDVHVAKQDSEKRLEALQASTRLRGGATITANNSFKQSLQLIELPGLDVRQEDDVIRIEIPADRLFVVNTSQLQAGAYGLLDQVAESISRNYSRQKIVIEGHTDAAPIGSGSLVSNHQLSSSQAIAVFDQFTRRNRLPDNQFSTMAFGANYPRVSNATPAGRAKNRRIELAIYPETIDAR
jgi:chemotaxis protein MotB